MADLREAIETLRQGYRATEQYVERVASTVQLTQRDVRDIRAVLRLQMGLDESQDPVPYSRDETDRWLGKAPSANNGAKTGRRQGQ